MNHCWQRGIVGSTYRGSTGSSITSARHLGEELTLAALARVAAFSPFHFHRVFRVVTGETLFAFIQRLRLERSASVLAAAPDRSVLEVALVTASRRPRRSRAPSRPTSA